MTAAPWLDPSALTAGAERAKSIYLAGLDPERYRRQWHEVMDGVASEVRDELEEALRDDESLQALLERSGGVMAQLRQLTAPPLSQDQFRLLCPDWPKTTEKSGRSIPPATARKVVEALRPWLDPRITEQDDPAAAAVAGPLYILARQRFDTQRRTRLAREQEQAVLDLLVSRGMVQKESRLVDQPWTIGENAFMQRTTFRSNANDSAEVDVAVGLRNGRLLALECKVSNDETNSVKRVNDVMKKQEAWHREYGQVLTTAALLQGVFAGKEVRRLAGAGVCVFFSHDLRTLGAFLDEQA
ncbi:MAG: XamI family restriction endonuclease [Planctomycetota bacterium]